MSLLNFAKDMGAKLFARDDQAAKNIKQNLDVSLTDASGIDVDFDDGVVTLSGTCDSQKTKELAALLCGNVKGVERVVSDALVPKAARSPAARTTTAAADPGTAPQAAPTADVSAEAVEFYDIKSGDTLGAIAKKFYGKASAYTRIFEANREVIKDPNKIYPGQKIRIPRP